MTRMIMLLLVTVNLCTVPGRIFAFMAQAQLSILNSLYIVVAVFTGRSSAIKQPEKGAWR